MKTKVLITGACGVTSRSIVRSLKMSEYYKDRIECIGTDICALKYGLYEGLYSKIYKVPRYNDPMYRAYMGRIIDENNIDCAFIIPELEALEWSRNPFEVSFMRFPLSFSEIVISKSKLYSTLNGTGLIPRFCMFDRNKNNSGFNTEIDYPVWIRDCEEGSTSGRGSFLARDDKQLKLWLDLNTQMRKIMVSEYLPGRNLACFLLFENGELLQYGVAERIQYIMSAVALSGITGNTSYGKLLNDEYVVERAKAAVIYLTGITGEIMNGLVVVDLKENENGEPYVTEINLRHVAFTSTFAKAGLNFSESQMFCMEGMSDRITVRGTIHFPDNNAMLRDVDGEPIFVENYKELDLGECVWSGGIDKRIWDRWHMDH